MTAVAVDFASVPHSDGAQKVVYAKVQLPDEYETGGFVVEAGDCGLSTLIFIDDAQGKGWLLRFVRDSFPARIQVIGADEDGNPGEAQDGEDISAIGEVRLRVIGW